VTELERALSALAREVAFPPEPDLAPGVLARLGEPGRRRRSWPVAVALAAALAVAFAVPQARSSILRFLHLGGVTIERVETLPPAQERPLGYALGTRIPTGRVRADTGLRPLLPRGTAPKNAYVQHGVVSFLLSAYGKPLLLSELAGDGFVKKAAGAGTSIDRVRVGRDTGYWLAGRRHVLEVVSTPPRLAGNVLIWVHDNLTLRLEGDLTRDEALRLARGVR
jgi:hypothetical protein